MKQCVKNIRTPIPRIAAVHDLSGYGRASLTVAIPVLSSMGMQVCPLPTAVLSSQTASIDDFSFFDLTAQMQEIVGKWENLGLYFDAVYSGFGQSRAGGYCGKTHAETRQKKQPFSCRPRAWR